MQPTRQPSGQPTAQPVANPSSQPTGQPTAQPSTQHTRRPSSPTGRMFFTRLLPPMVTPLPPDLTLILHSPFRHPSPHLSLIILTHHPHSSLTPDHFSSLRSAHRTAQQQTVLAPLREAQSVPDRYRTSSFNDGSKEGKYLYSNANSYSDPNPNPDPNPDPNPGDLRGSRPRSPPPAPRCCTS